MGRNKGQPYPSSPHILSTPYDFFLSYKPLYRVTYLNKSDCAKGRGDGLQLGVLDHEHVLDARVGAVKRTVPGDVVAHTKGVFYKIWESVNIR